MSRLFSLGAVVLALGALTTLLTAAPAPKTTPTANWPQFRGPNRDNISPDKGLLKEWLKGAPMLVWKAVGVGEGYSSVSVVGDKIFTMGDKDGSSWVFAVGRDQGEIVWSAKVGKAGGGGGYVGTRGTPTVDGDRLYAIGQFGDLVCLETAGGKERWRKNFGKDFEGRSGGWKYSESPLIDGDRLICTPGGPKATMIALNKKTGDVIWRSPLGDTAGYSSIVISNAAGVKQYVQLTAGGTVGVDAQNGKELWRYTKLSPNTANIPTPVVLGDQIFTCAGYHKGGALLTLSAAKNGVSFKEEYFNPALENKHGGVVIVGDYVYSDTDDSGNVHCAEWRTGKVKWTRGGTKGAQRKGRGSASLTYADEMQYIHYANGWMALVPAGPDGYVEKGGFKVPESERAGSCWAHPVVIGGRLYIREKDNLFCYDVTAK